MNPTRRNTFKLLGLGALGALGSLPLPAAAHHCDDDGFRSGHL
jgi:hypothetical protein